MRKLLEQIFFRVSRFEGRIMLAIVVCATVPLLISLVFIPSIIETKLAMSMHAAVEEQLEASALFYREFFDAKKREYDARADALTADLGRFCGAEPEHLRHELEARLQEQPELRMLRIVREEETVASARGPEALFDPTAYKPRALKRVLCAGAELNATFVLPAHHLEDRRRAEDIALNYQAARRMESNRARAFYMAYFGILAVAVTIALVVGLYLSRSVTRRVLRIARATEEVARGDMSIRVDVDGDDEIARLTDGFNRMVGEVEAARDRIVYLEKVSGWQDLARRLAHEIKNPLTPIRLAVHELRRRSNASDARLAEIIPEVAEVVDEEVEALTHLVEEFSRFARLPAVRPARVELRGFLERFQRGYARFRPELDLEVELPAPGLEAPLDRLLMRRVLANLVDNAAECGPERVRVGLRGAPHGRDGGCVLVVEDDGPGVAEELRRRIFEPYFTTKSSGTGLGLAIVKKIVLQHGGTIDLGISRRGGAAFTITLPPPPPDLELDDEGEDDEDTSDLH